jgi:hypothetical protein
MTETTTVPVLTPEQTAALFAQFQAQQDAEKTAAKAQREKDKAEREAKMAALTPDADAFVRALIRTVRPHETQASIDARADARKTNQPEPAAKFTRTFSVPVIVPMKQADGSVQNVKFTFGGYCSVSAKQPK